MHHFGLGVGLQGEEVENPHFGQQTLNECEVIFFILINLLTLRIVGFESKFILPVFQTMFLKHLSNHLRYRLIDKKAVGTELLAQQRQERLNNNLVRCLVSGTTDTLKIRHHTMHYLLPGQPHQRPGSHGQRGRFGQQLS